MRGLLIGAALVAIGLAAVSTAQPPPTDLPLGAPLAPPPAKPAALDGVWEVTAAIDDGEAFSSQMIREKLVKEGKITITGQVLTFVKPLTDEKREILFVGNSKASPATIDLAGETGSKGIYLLSGDTMMVCLSGPGLSNRPTDFGSAPGSHNLLMTMKRVPIVVPARPNISVPAAIVPPIAPAPIKEKMTDAQVRQMLIGTWGHQDRDKVEYITLNQDGSFTILADMKRAFKKLFEGEQQTSGTWKLENGVIVMTVSASTEKSVRGQIFSYRINSITDRDLIYIDMQGGVRREWKVR